MSLYDFEMNNLVEPHSHRVTKSSLKNYLSQSKVYFVGTGLNKMQNILCHKNAIEINPKKCTPLEPHQYFRACAATDACHYQ